jgi:hypothetical protein
MIYRIMGETGSWAHVRVWWAKPAGADQMAIFISDLVELLNHPYMACIVLVALVFDFLNGFHDAANSIATIVGTRVLQPFHAVLWAARSSDRGWHVGAKAGPLRQRGHHLEPRRKASPHRASTASTA